MVVYIQQQVGGEENYVGLKHTGKSLSVLLNEEMYEKLKADANENGLGISSFIKVIISNYYKQKETKQ